MAIALSNGLVTLQGGLASCVCCETACSPASIYCIILTFYGASPESYVVVYYQDPITSEEVWASKFDAFGEPDLSYPYLIWNTTDNRWQVSDGTLITSPTVGGSTDYCDPVSAFYTLGSSPPYDAEVTLGDCSCDPNYTDYCVDIDGTTYTVTGDLDSGYFENVGNCSLAWDPVELEWVVCDATYCSDAGSGSKNRCDPTLGSYTSSGWTTVTITQGAC